MEFIYIPAWSDAAQRNGKNAGATRRFKSDQLRAILFSMAVAPATCPAITIIHLETIMQLTLRDGRLLLETLILFARKYSAD